MTLFSLIIALLIEQLRPSCCVRGRPGTAEDVRPLKIASTTAMRGMEPWPGVYDLPPVSVTALIYFLLLSLHPLLGVVFNVLVLYLTMGFRQGQPFLHRHPACAADG